MDCSSSGRVEQMDMLKKKRNKRVYGPMEQGTLQKFEAVEWKANNGKRKASLRKVDWFIRVIENLRDRTNDSQLQLPVKWCQTNNGSIYDVEWLRSSQGAEFTIELLVPPLAICRLFACPILYV